MARTKQTARKAFADAIAARKESDVLRRLASKEEIATRETEKPDHAACVEEITPSRLAMPPTKRQSMELDMPVAKKKKIAVSPAPDFEKKEVRRSDGH
jgi:hypothetical protein